MDMREEFESGWGSYNDTQGIYFIPELNMYGCDLYVYQAIADRKSSAWYYFQKGWNASRESLVVELHKDFKDDTGKPFGELLTLIANAVVEDCRKSIHATGIRTK